MLEQEGLRDGAVPPVGETFPTRPFPTTDFTQAGIFIQDQIDFMDGRVVVLSRRCATTPMRSIRTADALYTLPIADQDDSRVTPRIRRRCLADGNVWRVLQLCAGLPGAVAEPGQQQLRQSDPGLHLDPQSRISKPETSEALELGVRLAGRRRCSARELRAKRQSFMVPATRTSSIQVQVRGTFRRSIRPSSSSSI